MREHLPGAPGIQINVPAIYPMLYPCHTIQSLGCPVQKRKSTSHSCMIGRSGGEGM